MGLLVGGVESAPCVDTDGDGADDVAESIARTDAISAASVLRLVSRGESGSAAARLGWATAVGRHYTLETHHVVAEAGSRETLTNVFPDIGGYFEHVVQPAARRRIGTLCAARASIRKLRDGRSACLDGSTWTFIIGVR